MKWLTILTLAVIAIIFFSGITRTPKNTVQHQTKRPFAWSDMSNTSSLKVCRNSKQGPDFMTDEFGYICRMVDLKQNKCCNIHGNTTTRFSCMTCKSNRCCKLYEHCVSCCLNPEKRPLLEKVLTQAQYSRNAAVFSMVRDTFELCLHKCRTSSMSVVTENRYINSVYKHCYGLDAPDGLHTIK